MNDFYVYQLRVEGDALPFYIGKGRKYRTQRHFELNNNYNPWKTNKIAKAEREGKKVLVEHIKTDLCEDDAFLWEVFYIAEYGRRDLGTGYLTNLTDGGEGMTGWKASEETKAKMSAAQRRIAGAKGYIKQQTEESKRMISATLSKRWKIVLPDGSEVEIVNLHQYCKENNLNTGAMCQVAAGKRPKHKGYACIKLN